MKRNQFIKSCVGLVLAGTVANSLAAPEKFFADGYFEDGYGYIFTYLKSDDWSSAAMLRMSGSYIDDKRFKVFHRGLSRYIEEYEAKGGSDLRIITPGIPTNFIAESNNMNKTFRKFQVVETSLALDGYKVYQIEKV